MQRWWRRGRELFRRHQVDREAVAELEHHIELAVAEKVRRGVAEREARRLARLELGGIDGVREQLAEGRAGFTLDLVRRELGTAWRALVRAPGSTVASAAAIAAGLAASTVLFVLIDGIVWRPLPYPAPDRLVRLFDTNPQLGVDRAGAASGNIDDWRRGTRLFEGIAGYYTMGRTLSTAQGATVVLTAQVSTDFFPLTRVAPRLGRTFTEDETRAAQFTSAAAPIGANPVAVISHAIWQQQFGADPDIVGRTVTLERRPFRIVGVMPEGFALPEAGVEIWMPWDLSGERPRDQHYLGALARVASTASLAQAEDELNRVAATLAGLYPASNAGWGVRVRPLAAEVVGEMAQTLWTLFAAVGLVLVVACANVALLSIMRGLDRSVEHAVRLALGSTPQRLRRQCWMESLMLAGLGGLAGLAVAAGVLAILPRLAPDIPRLDEVSLDVRGLSFALVVTAVVAALSGFFPARRSRHVEPAAELRATATRTTATGRQHRLRDALVTAQIALALVLLCGSGLLAKSYLTMQRTDPGFDPEQVLVAPIFLDSQAYGSGDQTRAYYATVFERLAALPGVVAVGGATTLPTSPLGPDFDRPVWPAGAVDERDRVPAAVRMATPGYFDVLRLDIVAGRRFDARDHADAPPVVMVSETLARRLWPDRAAVGQRLMVDYSSAGTAPYEVVGVVGSVRFRGPRSAPRPEIYLPHAQRPYLILNVAIRTTGDPRALIPAVRSTLATVDPHKPAYALTPLSELFDATMGRDRQALFTLLVFAVAAVGLAGLGVYGVLSARVRERRREIGIRMALGADRRRILTWVAEHGLRLWGRGVAIGLAATWLLSSLWAGLLYGVSPTDAATPIAVVGGLLAAGIVIMVLPAWRATRVDPVTVLRRG